VRKRSGLNLGFSLVEVALSLAILAVGMVGVLALLPVGLDAARQVHAETVAANVARSALGQFMTNTTSSTAWEAIIGIPAGGIFKTEYWPVDGQTPPNPTDRQGKYFRLVFQKGPEWPANNPTTCRYFLNLAWPEEAVNANTNSPLIQRRTFLVDLVRTP
jgi:prepilin-type N-terminal cleavage/methylation domain-containing protein